jgi:cyclopropane fatty-acyl-phospholipid synthase-like methyltransferase
MENESLESGSVRSPQEQAAWEAWNLEKDRGAEEYCQRMAQIARECAVRAGSQRVVEVGCGNGWLMAALEGSFASRWACDISVESVETARKRVPGADFVAGDFLALPLETLPAPASVDLVVSCEVVAHVSDQRAFFKRCRALTKPTGRLLLFTQNPTTWSRSSYLEPVAPGRLRHWPTRAELAQHFTACGYRLESLDTIEPHGDRGLLAWRPYANGVIRRGLGLVFGQDEGRARTKRFFERIGFGRTLVVEAVAV